jgi:hypothetical protein
LIGAVLVIGSVSVVVLLGIDFCNGAKELPGAGAVLPYSTGSNRQPYIIGLPFGAHRGGPARIGAVAESR